MIYRQLPAENRDPIDDPRPGPRRRLSLLGMLGMLALGLAALALVAMLVLVFAVAMAVHPF